MKPRLGLRVGGSLGQIAVAIALLAALGGTSAGLGGGPPVGVVVWDTGSSSEGTVDVRDRTEWKVVPPDLLTLEADPLKASSDPGYYGREYAFEGDAIVENHYMTVVFRSGKGTVTIYSRSGPGAAIVELAPCEIESSSAHISHHGLVQNSGDEVSLEVVFSGGSIGEDRTALFSFDNTQIVAIQPVRNMKGLTLSSRIEYGIVPSFIGDDLIFNPREYASTAKLSAPCENLFLGLLAGEDRVLVLTWPAGRQRMTLGLSDEGQGMHRIDSVHFENDGQSAYLAVLEAPGIWHQEELKRSFLEKDVTIDWKRPFPAKWVTQLNEAGVNARFAFREAKGRIWRGVPGMYTYPVWFDGDNAVYHLGKRVLPKGHSVIYFLEGKGTPTSISTPVDILKATLGRQACVSILDAAGRRLRTHHRRGAAGIRRACTCGCTEAIEAIFAAGQEVARSQYVTEAVADMVYFVRVHMERIDEYRRFADDLIEFLHQARASTPELKPVVDALEQTAQQIRRDYDVQKVNIKSLAHADELARQTVALTRRASPANRQACLDLGKEWRGMGGAQDSLLAQFHMTARELFQQAGYACAAEPQAVDLAQEIRRRCRQCLRNPDGYEIWAGY